MSITNVATHAPAAPTERLADCLETFLDTDRLSVQQLKDSLMAIAQCTDGPRRPLSGKQRECALTAIENAPRVLALQHSRKFEAKAHYLKDIQCGVKDILWADFLHAHALHGPEIEAWHKKRQEMRGIEKYLRHLSERTSHASRLHEIEQLAHREILKLPASVHHAAQCAFNASRKDQFSLEVARRQFHQPFLQYRSAAGPAPATPESEHVKTWVMLAALLDTKQYWEREAKKERQIEERKASAKMHYSMLLKKWLEQAPRVQRLQAQANLRYAAWMHIGDLSAPVTRARLPWERQRSDRQASRLADLDLARSATPYSELSGWRSCGATRHHATHSDGTAPSAHGRPPTR